jgi:hypothetical protein
MSHRWGYAVDQFAGIAAVGVLSVRGYLQSPSQSS